MSWTKVDVEGRTMWQSSSGERVADSSMIDAMQGNAARVNRDIDAGAGLIVFGFILGAIAGAVATYAVMV